MSVTSPSAVRHFLDLSKVPARDLRQMLDASLAMKSTRVRGEPPASRPLAGKTLAMIFDQPSTRTRVSFEKAIRELGGDAMMLTGAEMQLGRGETLADTAFCSSSVQAASRRRTPSASSSSLMIKGGTRRTTLSPAGMVSSFSCRAAAAKSPFGTLTLSPSIRPSPRTSSMIAPWRSFSSARR